MTVEESTNDEFVVGACLATLDSQLRTNGIIINETNNGYLVVLTDFGNLLHIQKSNIHNHYQVQDHWIKSITTGQPLPTICKRIQQQIHLLKEAYLIAKQLEVIAGKP